MKRQEKYPNLKAGNTKNVGRKKSGRLLALDILDEIIAETENLDQLRKEFDQEFKEGATKFYKKYIEPLIPKDAKLSIDPEKNKIEISVKRLDIEENNSNIDNNGD